MNTGENQKKVVINARHGGFSLSHKAVLRYAEIKGLTLYCDHDGEFSKLLGPTYWLVPEGERPEPQDKWHEWDSEQRIASNLAHEKAKLYDRDIPRDDPALVQVVEEMGEAANSRFSSLRVVAIPADVEWQIEEYDGSEWVAEKHRTWHG